MKSGKVCSGLKVRFEWFKLFDLFFDDEFVVLGRGFLILIDQSFECVLDFSVEIVEFREIEVEVMEDIEEDWMFQFSEMVGEVEDLCVVVGQVCLQISYLVLLRI